MALACDLRTCLAEVLGSDVPEADGSAEPVRFFSQWLAERNLGFAPIAEPATFDWAGKRIAIVDADDGRHAVLMFGSPSGPWLDPSGAYADGAPIVAGWMPTPLDLHLSTNSPYGAPGVRADAGRGRGARRDPALVGGRPAQRRHLRDRADRARRPEVPGRRGGVHRQTARRALRALEKLARPGLLRPLVHRGGLRADILSGGTISVGDEVSAS